MVSDADSGYFKKSNGSSEAEPPAPYLGGALSSPESSGGSSRSRTLRETEVSDSGGKVSVSDTRRDTAVDRFTSKEVVLRSRHFYPMLFYHEKCLGHFQREGAHDIIVIGEFYRPSSCQTFPAVKQRGVKMPRP